MQQHDKILDLNAASLGAVLQRSFALDSNSDADMIGYDTARALISVVSRSRHVFSADDLAAMVRLVIRIFDMYPELALDHAIDGVLGALHLGEAGIGQPTVDVDAIGLISLCPNVDTSAILQLCDTREEIEIVARARLNTFADVLKVLDDRNSQIDVEKKVCFATSVIRNSKYVYNHDYMKIGAELIRLLGVEPKRVVQPVQFLISVSVLSEKIGGMNADQIECSSRTTDVGCDLLKSSEALNEYFGAWR